MQSNLRYLKRRSRTNFVTSLFSIALVLFFLGLFATLLLLGRSFTTQAKGSIQLQVFLAEFVDHKAQFAFTDSLLKLPYVKDAEFISKEEAGKIFLERTGEDVSEILGGLNPLQSSLNLKLEAAYIHPDSLSYIKAQLSQSPMVSDVSYPLDMIESASKNIQTLTLVFFGVGILLIAIAFYLIIGTIRLSIYSQRISIYTMQLIGATSNFIRKPFLLNGLLNGFLASLLAILFLMGALRLADNWLVDLGVLKSFSVQNEFIGILIGIVLFGTTLGLVGSFWAVNRYLHRKLDDLL